jgi:uncharacterized protein YcaQ
MVHRSHYVVPWSRLGNYDPRDLDRLIYHPEGRRLFEDWWHAASIVPLAAYRYLLPDKERFHEGGKDWEQGWWLSKPANRELMFRVLERIRQEGALRAIDFQDGGPKRGSWWDWKPAKHALEYLWARGDVMIASRVSFQRVYDLTERVLPAWVDTSRPTDEEIKRYRIEQAVRALGVCQPLQAAEYAYMKRSTAKPVVETLMNEGTLVAISALLSDNKAHSLIVHRDNLPLLEQVADGVIQARRTTFLSPFDNLFWAKGRDLQFWNFQNVLEAYKPKPQRQWGYFCLSILHNEHLVGRFDPKLARKEGRLHLRAIYLEPGIAPDEELVTNVARAMQDFMAFHNATELVVEFSSPMEFGDKLLAAL